MTIPRFTWPFVSDELIKKENRAPKFYWYDPVGILFMIWYYRVRVVVFNPTFNNISAILQRSVLLVEETGVPEKNTPDKLYHIML